MTQKHGICISRSDLLLFYEQTFTLPALENEFLVLRKTHWVCVCAWVCMWLSLVLRLVLNASLMFKSEIFLRCRYRYIKWAKASIKKTNRSVEWYHMGSKKPGKSSTADGWESGLSILRCFCYPARLTCFLNHPIIESASAVLQFFAVAQAEHYCYKHIPRRVPFCLFPCC